jgi:hypothetical protein
MTAANPVLVYIPFAAIVILPPHKKENDRVDAV